MFHEKKTLLTGIVLTDRHFVKPVSTMPPFCFKMVPTNNWQKTDVLFPLYSNLMSADFPLKSH